jgi:hypothetical protein
MVSEFNEFIQSVNSNYVGRLVGQAQESRGS